MRGAGERWRPWRAGEFVGVGCVVQGGVIAVAAVAAVVAPDLLPLWAVVALGGLILGGRMAHKWLCPVCESRLASKWVKVCPGCGAGTHTLLVPPEGVARGTGPGGRLP